MSLEQQVTRGHVACICSINHTTHRDELVLELVDDPETGQVSRLLKFSEVKNYLEHWDEDADHEGLQSLIGLDEYPEGKWTRYVVAMDEVELSFISMKTPLIADA